MGKAKAVGRVVKALAKAVGRVVKALDSQPRDFRFESYHRLSLW